MSQNAIAVVWCVLQVTLISLLAMGACAIARRFTPAAGSLIPLAGLLLVLMLSIFAFCSCPSWFDLAPKSFQPANNDSPVSNADSAELDTTESEELKSIDVSPTATATIAQFWQAFSHELSRPANTISAEAPRSRFSLSLAILFVIGALLGTLHLVAGLVAVRSYRRRSRAIADRELIELVDVLQAELSLRRKVEIRQCDDLVTAATIGWLRPLVLLPPEWYSWKGPERRAVLAHELAHIARHDFLGAVIAQVSLSLHFYHPLVHWLAARLRLEQELAADAAAAALVGGPTIYLRTLADLALRQPERRMGWPARTFLPSRGTFLRRIEMLRDARRLPVKRSPAFRWLLVGLMILAGLAVTGLRGPSGGAPALVAAQPAKAGVQVETENTALGARDKAGIDLAYIPGDAVLVAAFRPAGLLRRGDMKDVRERLDELFAPHLGMSPAEFEQVTLVVHGSLAPRREPAAILPVCGVVIRTVKPSDFRKAAEKFLPDAVEKKLGGAPGQSYFRSPDPQNGVCYYQPDDRTLVIDLEEPIVRSIVGKPKKSPLVSSDAWKRAAEGQAALAIDGNWARSLIAPAEPANRPRAFPTEIEAFSPLWLEAETFTLSVRFDDKVTLRAAIVGTSDEGAKRVQETAEAGRVLIRNLMKPMRKELAQAPPAERPILESLFELGETLLDEVKFEREGKRVEASTATEIDPLKLSLLTMVVTRAREAASQSSNANNLKQIGLAMHNYHDTYTHFPAAAILGPDGKTVHSWRVAILPYIEQDALYRAYKFDEPWDSENNKKILAKMPAVYRHPSAPKDSTSADYYALVGDKTVFSNKASQKGTKIFEIADGTSNTFMIVEAKRDIPWTKPDDIPYSADKPLPKFGGWSDAGFYAALCDGSVHLMNNGIEERLFRAWITRDGGEPISFDPRPAPGKPAQARAEPKQVDAPEPK